MKKKSSLLFIILVICLFSYKYYIDNKKPDVIIKEDVIKESLLNVKELTTTKYYYTNMASFSNQKDIYGFKIPLTKKSFIISYDGIISVGVDLKDVDIIISEENIIVKLPDIKILSHEINEESITIFNEETSIFNSIKIDDYKNFSIDQKKLVEKKAIDEGLFIKARENLENSIKDIIFINEDIREKYSIVFK